MLLFLPMAASSTDLSTAIGSETTFYKELQPIRKVEDKVSWLVPGNWVLHEHLPVSLDSSDFDLNAVYRQPRRLQESLVQQRMVALENNVPTEPVRLLVWQHQPQQSATFSSGDNTMWLH